MRQTLYLVLGLLVLASIVAAPAPPATAAGIVVNTTTDELNSDGDCSLREAITAANTDAAVDGCPAGSGADTVTVPAGTYTLSIAGMYEDAAATGDLDVTGDLTINGAGAGSVVIDGGALDRVLHILPFVAVEISGVAVRNGNTARIIGPGDPGGGILNEFGAVTLTNVTVNGNAASEGGGIASWGIATLTNVTVSGNAVGGNGGGFSGGPATLTNVTVSGNTAGDGGGIYGGNITLTNVTVSGNTARNHGGGIDGSEMTLTNVTVSDNSAAVGGGIRQDDGTATLTNVTVSGNAAGLSGGGISNSAGSTITLTNATISGNTASDRGGGIAHSSLGTATLTNVTVSGNSAVNKGGGIYDSGTAALTNVTVNGNTSATGGGIYMYPGGYYTVTSDNTIVANSVSGGDCAGTMTSNGYNLDSDGTCGFSGTGDLPSTNPQLGPLADNGGPTETHALMPSSPAVDAGNNAACPGNDQRGVARPQGAACDIGAYERVLDMIQGDADCNGLADSVDALSLLRHVAGLSVSQQPDCTPIDTGDPLFGDVDCDGTVNAVDALKVLRYVASLSVAQAEPCPDVGTPIPGG